MGLGFFFTWKWRRWLPIVSGHTTSAIGLLHTSGVIRAQKLQSPSKITAYPTTNLSCYCWKQYRFQNKVYRLWLIVLLVEGTSQSQNSRLYCQYLHGRLTNFCWFLAQSSYTFLFKYVHILGQNHYVTFVYNQCL